jgi:hypothetical protein
MPEGKEGTCVGEDAAAVAAYIYNAFYSPTAQAKLRPVQESLSRLTVAQYQNSVADLVGRFRPGFDRAPAAERGLRAVYSGFLKPTPEELAGIAAEKNFEKRKELEKAAEKKERLERVESRLAVSFGGEAPNPEKMIPEKFSADWHGSLVTTETGLYEFVLRSENGVRLFVNDIKDPIIDAWVSTGPEVREEKKSIFLLGGRTYRLMVNLVKFKDKSASIELWWKPPHGTLELMPESQLVPFEARPNMVVNTRILNLRTRVPRLSFGGNRPTALWS